MPFYIKYDGIEGEVTSPSVHRGESQRDRFSFDGRADDRPGVGTRPGKVDDSDGPHTLEVKLPDLLITSYQSGGHAGASVEPDPLFDGLIIDTCGGGDGSSLFGGFATETVLL